MRLKRISVPLSLVAVLAALPLAAEGPEWKRARLRPDVRIDEVRTAPREPLLSRNGIEVYPLRAEDAALARTVLEARKRQGEGGGGDVANILLIQSYFENGGCRFEPDCQLDPCNVVLLLWDENTFNASGVDVFLNGNLLGTLNGLPEDQLPGLNGVNVLGVPAGNHVFRIEEGDSGTFDECSIPVVDTPPLPDAQNVVCKDGGIDPVGNCNYVIEWGFPELNPDAQYGVLLDGEVADVVEGAELGTVIQSVPAGPHTIQVVGILPVPGNDCAIWRGCFIAADCPESCNPDVCPPPALLRLCQSAYGEEGEIRADWLNPVELYLEGINGFFDGASLGDPVSGDTQLVFVGPIAPGEHTFGVQGDCGPPQELSDVTEATLAVLAETPYADPVVGDIACSFDPGAGETTIAWNPSSPFAFADIYVRVPPDQPGNPPAEFFVGSVGSGVVGVTLGGTDGTETPLVQFFNLFDGQCYGSEKIPCVPFSPCAHCLAGDIVCGESRSAEFRASGCPVGGVLGPAADIYRFPHLEDGRVIVRVETDAFTPVLRILDADCNEVAAQEAPGPELSANLPAGEFSIELSALEGSNASGAYSVEVTCVADFFIRGACGEPDVVNPQITQAIFILGFLFQGTAAPPCMEACDIDDNGQVEITDAVRLLQFLFQGGAPPAGWIGTDPTCTPVTAETDCAVPNTSCPLAP